MTVNIDYEADKKLDFDYEKIIRRSSMVPLILKNVPMKQK